jgi:hypothetical protein
VLLFDNVAISVMIVVGLPNIWYVLSDRQGAERDPRSMLELVRGEERLAWGAYGTTSSMSPSRLNASMRTFGAPLSNGWPIASDCTTIESSSRGVTSDGARAKASQLRRDSRTGSRGCARSFPG